MRLPGLIIGCFAILCTSCNKQDEEVLDFSSIHKFDINAQPMGNTGKQPDDDFQNENWDTWVTELFKPMDTAFLPTSKAPTVINVLLYPNPCYNSNYVSVNTDSSCNLKIVVIDINKTIVRSFSRTISTPASGAAFDYRDVPIGYYRCYYALSVADRPFFYKAHADIQVIH